jgi:hypothetical protein
MAFLLIRFSGILFCFLGCFFGFILDPHLVFSFVVSCSHFGFGFFQFIFPCWCFVFCLALCFILCSCWFLRFYFVVLICFLGSYSSFCRVSLFPCFHFFSQFLCSFIVFSLVFCAAWFCLLSRFVLFLYSFSYLVPFVLSFVLFWFCLVRLSPFSFFSWFRVCVCFGAHFSFIPWLPYP